ncbi:MAG: hypothetical protein KGJ36_01485 [Acidobacteriota bacterium]|nr:hypothetical protein [Acidobacteriota bacterium]
MSRTRHRCSSRHSAAESQADDAAKSGLAAGIRIFVAVVAVSIAITLIGRRRGYSFGRNTIARCRRGHLFTTTWIPGASVKAIRLGWWRFQYCPVGRHWTLVVPVKESDLSNEDVERARSVHDINLP